MKLEDMKLTVTDESGNQVICDVLLTFENEETGKNYIVYTDNTKDSLGKVQVYASVYTQDDQTCEVSLQEIETDEEWETVSEAIEMAREEVGL